MIRHRLAWLSLLGLVALLGSLVPQGAVAQFPSQGGGTGSGGYYQSSYFGFSLAWGPQWALVGEYVDDASEAIELTNGISGVLIGAYFNPATPQDFVVAVADIVGGGELQFVEALYDEPGRAAAFFVAPESGYGAFIDAIELGQTAKQLVLFIFPTDQFDAQWNEFLILLGGFSPAPPL